MDSINVPSMGSILKKIFLTLKTKGPVALFLSIKNYLQIVLYKKFFPYSFIKKKIFNYQMFLNPKDKGISRTLILFGKRELDHREILFKVLKKKNENFRYWGKYWLLRFNGKGNNWK